MVRLVRVVMRRWTSDCAVRSGIEGGSWWIIGAGGDTETGERAANSGWLVRRDYAAEAWDGNGRSSVCVGPGIEKVGEPWLRLKGSLGAHLIPLL